MSLSASVIIGIVFHGDLFACDGICIKSATGLELLLLIAVSVDDSVSVTALCPNPAVLSYNCVCG